MFNSSSEEISIIEDSLNDVTTLSLAPLGAPLNPISRTVVCISSSSDDEIQPEKLTIPSTSKPSKRLNLSDVTFPPDIAYSSTPKQTAKKVDNRNSAIKALHNLHSTRIEDGEMSTPKCRDFSRLFKQYEQERENSSQEATQRFKDITPRINPQKTPPVKDVDNDTNSDSDDEIIRPRPTPLRKNRRFVSDSDSSADIDTNSEIARPRRTPSGKDRKFVSDSDSSVEINSDSQYKFPSSSSFGGCTMVVHDEDLSNSDDAGPSSMQNKIIEPILKHTDEQDVICIEDSDSDINMQVDSHKSEENKENANTCKTPRKNRKMLANIKKNILDTSYFTNKINDSSTQRIAELKNELERLFLEEAELKTKEKSIIKSLEEKPSGSVKQSLKITSRDLKHVKMRINTIESTLKKHPTDLKIEKETDIIDLTKKEDKPSKLVPVSSNTDFPKPVRRDESFLDQPVPEPWNIQNPDFKLSDLGKKALESHNAQRALTDEGLKAMHESLENFPNLQELDEDPEGIKVNLLPHQKKALKWLVWRETQNPSGGVLADDMGLGKTLTMLSLVLRQKNLKIDINDTGYPSVPCAGTLVVCPASVMGQWEDEIKCRVKNNSLSYLVYHGNKREANPKRIARFDVVITTYSLVQKQSDDGPLLSVMWNRVILDEAHVIRNHKTQTAQSVFKLRRKNSWALTGTPIHNKEMDYYSLIKFIKCKPFNDLTIWKRWVGNKNAAGMNRLNLITKTIMLRRTKDELNKAGSLDMQSKEMTIVRIKLDHDEYEIYEKVAQFSKAVLASFIQQRAEKEHLLTTGVPVRDVAKSLMNMNSEDNPFRNHPDLARLHRNMMTMGDKVKSHEILVLLLRLRQICCHPHLAVSIVEKEEALNDELEEVNTDLADKLFNLSICENPNDPRDKLSVDNPVFQKERISSKIRSVIECVMDIIDKTETDKLIVVSQWTSMLTLIEKVLEDYGLSTLSLTGKIPVKDRAPIIETFNKDGKSPRIFLLSLAAGGTGLNLIGGNHLLIVDIHWNPQLEAQACDRIYRVGQKKSVHIYKFICTDTIEERIEQLQMKKLEVAQDVLTGSMKVQKLTLMDLKHLFGL